jgi:integrase
MLKLQWKDIDFLNDVLQVGRSKSNAGIRAVPISAQCKAELLRWRNLIGPEFSEWTFPNFTTVDILYKKVAERPGRTH